MQIIPAINCENFECVKEKLQKAEEINFNWVQIDIADGIFTRALEPPIGGSVRGFAPHKTWNNPEEFNDLRFKIYDLGLSLEVHLMVENPLDVIDEWVKAGARRIILHIEAIENNELKSLKVKKLKSDFKNCEFGLAINPITPVENLIPFLNDFKFIQILAVDPGLSGQKFQLQVLEKIKFLKKNYSDVIIEVDGGINLETAKMCKDIGVDILVVGSYIWQSGNPKEAFEKLQKILNDYK